MKLILRLILIVLLTYLMPIYFPWWGIVPGAMLIGFLIPGNGFNVFISGFLGVGVTWMVYAWYLDYQSSSILSEKIITLFPFNDKIYLIIGAGIIGALSGGLGILTGTSFRQLFMKRKQKSYYN